MSDTPLTLTTGLHGFAWGPVEVRRTMSINGRVLITIQTDAGQSIDVYVSKTGRSLRIFKKGQGELT
jgi:hypothetical protein